MARIRIVDVFDHLNVPLRKALDDALDRTAPGIEVDRAQLYREFRRAVAARCKTWENVPNQAVDAE